MTNKILKKCGRRVNRFRLFPFAATKFPRKLGRICRAFLREDDGQAVIEYILILSVTVIGAGMLARGILKALDNGVLKLGGQLEKDLKTGKAPLTVYQN